MLFGTDEAILKAMCVWHVVHVENLVTLFASHQDETERTDIGPESVTN